MRELTYIALVLFLGLYMHIGVGIGVFILLYMLYHGFFSFLLAIVSILFILSSYIIYLYKDEI